MKIKKRKLSLIILITILLIAIFVVSIYAIASKGNEKSLSYMSFGEDEKTLQIEFFPLGNMEVGDSFIISYGDVQILVDAGSNGSSHTEIIRKMQKHMDKDKDKVWDYVIVTHPDQDHIACFSTSSILTPDKDTGVFKHLEDNDWKVGTLIDFDITQDNTVDYSDTLVNKDAFYYKEGIPEVKTTYRNYRDKRNAMVESGTIENYYTASQCVYEKRGIDCPKEGAKSTFKLTDEIESPVIHILYNYYYDHRLYDSQSVSSAEVNSMSVCFLIEYKSQRFLFTGDIEEYDSGRSYSEIYGETMLYDYNEELLQNGITFYKAAHHGSRTSSSRDFIDNIKPQIVVIPTIAGTSQHSTGESLVENRFPAQSVLSNFLEYTDMIYIPQKAILDPETNKIKKAENYYGEIVITSNGYRCNVSTTEEIDQTTGKPKYITDTQWFKDNRKDEGGSLITTCLELPEDVVALGQCTLVQYRHYDILIDCGIFSEGAIHTNDMHFFDRIASMCGDGVLEYVIISNAQTSCISNMIGKYKSDGTIEKSVFKELFIQTLIDFGTSSNVISSDRTSSSWIGRYFEQREESIKKGTNHLPVGTGSTVFKINDDFEITVINQSVNPKDENNYSLCTVIDFHGEKLVFAGNLNNDENYEQKLIEAYESIVSNATFLLANNGANGKSCTKEYVEAVSPEVVFIMATAGADIQGKNYADFYAIGRLSNKENDVYLSSQMTGKEKEYVGGDMIFIIDITPQRVETSVVTSTGNDNEAKETEWYINQTKE